MYLFDTLLYVTRQNGWIPQSYPIIVYIDPYAKDNRFEMCTGCLLDVLYIKTYKIISEIYLHNSQE